MILPFEQHSITFDDVRYTVDMPQGMKDQGVNEDRLELLKGVSGAFRLGVLTALMGVSGASKTTLMDVLWLVGKLVDILKGTSQSQGTLKIKKHLLEFPDTVNKMISTLKKASSHNKNKVDGCSWEELLNE